MDIEFHYYMTHLIALRAGFKSEDAFTIANAGQHTGNTEETCQIGGRKAFNEQKRVIWRK